MGKKIEKGDVVDMWDGSYAFGVKDSRYTRNCDNRDGSRNNLIVVQTGLKAMRDHNEDDIGPYCAVCDLLVTNGKGDFWFTQSRFVELSKHTISIDGKEIEVSHESYENLKKQLLGG